MEPTPWFGWFRADIIAEHAGAVLAWTRYDHRHHRRFVSCWVRVLDCWSVLRVWPMRVTRRLERPAVAAAMAVHGMPVSSGGTPLFVQILPSISRFFRCWSILTMGGW